MIATHVRSKMPFYIIIALLILSGIALTVHRHQTYGVPYLPTKAIKAWEIEARIDFNANNQPVKVTLAAPVTQDGFTKIDEKSASLGYGFTMEEKKKGRVAQWGIRSAEGPQTLYFSTTMLLDDTAFSSTPAPEGALPLLNFDQSLTTALNSIVRQASEQSANATGYVQEVIKLFNQQENQTTALLSKRLEKENAISALLTLESIPNRIVKALKLEDGRRQQQTIPMIQFWNKKKWQLLDLETGFVGTQENVIIWNASELPLLEISGAENGRATFSIIEQKLPPYQATQEKVKANQLFNFSIHSLPLEEQAMFKTILLIPIGALIVVFLRIIVGLKTSGTFMPVLIAVAFVQTQLLPGILSFLIIVGAGLIIRSYLSKLNLLLVARISSVIITVILLIVAFTVLSYKLGITQGLNVTFFPMIILSWTVERMSILWEEEGYKEVIQQGGGSLITAVLIYLAMSNLYIRYLTFNFIGLQLIILSIILILGNYTGYRLSELRRFKPFISSADKTKP